MRSLLFLFLLSLALASPLNPLYGLGFRIIDQDPEATARGDAFSATADNPSAIYYNPAGITQLDGEHLSIGAYTIYLKDHVRPAGGGPSYDTTDTLQAVPQIYYTIKPTEKFPVTFGLGIYAPFGLALQYPDNTPFRSLATEGNLTYVTANPVAAWQICPQLSIAMGLTVNYGDVTLRRGLYTPGDQFRFHGNGDALGFNAGLMYQPFHWLSLGMTYRSATSIIFEGHSDVRLKPYAAYGNDTTVRLPREQARAGIPFPEVAVFGVSLRPAKDWNFEFDLDWTDWNTLRTVQLTEPSSKIYLPFNWNSSFIYEFGLTHNFNYGLRGSLGYLYSANSVPGNSFNPLVPDSNRHVFSVGVGQDIRQFTWDVAYQFAYGPDRVVSNGSLADGTYSFISHAVSFSVGYRF